MIHRIDVCWDPKGHQGWADVDPLAAEILQQVTGVTDAVQSVAVRRIYLIDTDATEAQIQRIAAELLADPIVERSELFSPGGDDPIDESRIEVHLKPGVMDPVAASTEMAIRDMGYAVREVRTGRAYVLRPRLPKAQLQQIAGRVLANGVIESVYFAPHLPVAFEQSSAADPNLRRVELRRLDDAGLQRLSREGHLFLSLAEMKAIQSYYHRLERDPTDIELETIAQTWSEHCVHKTLKSPFEVTDESGKVLRRYGNLIKETIFAATDELMKKEREPFCLSVFKDNAGVIAFDESDAVCFKVETHNHPSAIEPYGGAATGVGGVIRDVLGSGLGAKPIANTDVFCVAFPDAESSIPNRKSKIASLPRGVIHPRRVLQQVVAGVRDYGNRMGIPTVNGAVYFDDRYIGNPLVFCGCAGLIPRDRIEKTVRSGDAIVLIGGRTGRDGIHGATFSSAQLSDTHADEFSHAVQIGNAITEKKVADVILAARDRNLFSAITDCGAGGLSSAVGEMGEKTGAVVELDKVPLKYAGLRYDEIWISEAQERMVLSVPRDRVDELLKLAADEGVETTVIGEFGSENRELILRYRDQEVGRVSMEFLHQGLPMPSRSAIVHNRRTGSHSAREGNQHELKTRDMKDRLIELLSHPNIASKHWIIRQYDHEVQGGSVIKPLVGSLQRGPSDAAVIRPKLDSFRGIAIACGLAPQIEDPYEMAVAAIDEAVRNAICVGAHPGRMAVLDNFCWPSVEDERTLGTLVRACEACRDVSLAYGIPFISGKDSLNNQLTSSETGEIIRIPNTLLVSAIGVIEDVRKCVTMDLKDPFDRIVLIRPQGGGSPSQLARAHRAVASAISAGLVRACHDVSDGGPLVSVAEMCIASGIGAVLPLGELKDISPFDERPGMYLVAVRLKDVDALFDQLRDDAVAKIIGDTSPTPRLIAFRAKNDALDVSIDELAQAWQGTLDW